MNEMLSPKEVAVRLKTTPPTVIRWITHGVRGKRLKGVRAGSQWRIQEVDLAEFMKGPEVVPPVESVKQRSRRHSSAGERLRRRLMGC